MTNPNYLLQLGDNTLILAQRLGEWCGHGPVLEQDIALTNVALDLLGQTRMLLSYAGELDGSGRNEDQLAYMRKEHEYLNVQLVEHPNEDWAVTMARQFFFDVFNYFNFAALTESKDERLAEIAVKAIKEVTYHLRFSSDWMLRMGDGTDTSKQKLQDAIEALWPYTGELFEPSEADVAMAKAGVAPNLSDIKSQWVQKVNEVFTEATVRMPDSTFMHSGGKSGRHTEAMGFILTELQYMQRTYPGQEW